MKSRYANILGEEYKVITEVSMLEDEYLQEAIGYCDSSIKKIVVAKLDTDDLGSLKNMKSHENKVIRHEIIHAFLNESGLGECSDWARNEEMVDFFAGQFPKMLKVFKKLDVI